MIKNYGIKKKNKGFIGRGQRKLGHYTMWKKYRNTRTYYINRCKYKFIKMHSKSEVNARVIEYLMLFTVRIT